MGSKAAAALREEAARIEREELKATRLADADRIPTCPTCGGRSFKVEAWTLVAQSANFPEDPDADDTADSLAWADDYQSGDHTSEYASAICNGCKANVEDVLERFGWTFYDNPKPNTGAKDGN